MNLPILERFQALHPKTIDFSLERIFRLLDKLGNPQQRLPPVVHVAGTNGKGSTLAFIRAILESMGWRVHMYTSPHLIHFRERIRVAGRLLDDHNLIEYLEYCEKINDGDSITFFEITTAAAFHIFSHVPADAVLLETGLGGRLDATNVIDRPAVTAITRLSLDHAHYLGPTVPDIAFEKAGILRPETPVVLAPHPDPCVIKVLFERTAALAAPIIPWSTEPTQDGFRYESCQRRLTLPPPRLYGVHQRVNAGVAIACSETLTSVSDDAIYHGVAERVSWPGRLESLTDHWPWTPRHELWLDGGHNDSAAEALAEQLALWSYERPLETYLIFGMSAKKDPASFLSPLSPLLKGVRAVSLPSDVRGIPPQVLLEAAFQSGLTDCAIEPDIETALRRFTQRYRILICGSLYLIASVYQMLGKDIA